MPCTGPVVQPQPATFGLFLRDFQALASPEAFDTLVIDTPALLAQQRGDPTITIAAIFAGQVDDRPGQRVFIVALHQHPALGGSGLPQNSTSTALGNSQLLLRMPHRLPPAFGAQ